MLGTVYGCLHPLPAPCGDMNWGWCNSLARRCLGRDCGISSAIAVTQASQGVSSHHILISLSLEIVNTLLSASPGIPARIFPSKQGDHIQLPPPLPGGEWLGVEELGPLVFLPLVSSCLHSDAVLSCSHLSIHQSIHLLSTHFFLKNIFNDLFIFCAFVFGLHVCLCESVGLPGTGINRQL